MSEVNNPSGYPNSAIGLIQATFSDGSSKIGVGTVVGKNDVVTSLTLLYDPELGWATDLGFHFGADYNVNANRFDNSPYSLTSGFRWETTGYTSQLFSDSDTTNYFQSEAQYDLAVIGLSEEIGLRTGWFGLEPNRDANAQTLSTIGFSGSQGMVSYEILVDKSALYGVYISASNPYPNTFDRSAGSPLVTADNYLVGVRSTANWWADVGFLYDFITSAISDNDDLLTVSTDKVSPILISAVPADESERVPVEANLIFTFSEPITRGTGTFVLRNSSGALVESFNIATSSRITISGSTLSINPKNNLKYGESYFLESSSGAVRDLSGNNYNGLTNYNFKTMWEIPAVSIDNAVVEEGDVGARDLVFKITLTTPSPEDVGLLVRTWAGTASTDSGDYNGFYERSFVIPAGQISLDLAISVNGDELFEPNEGFAVEIMSANGAVLGNTLARGWILDDDEPYPLPTDTFSEYQWHLYPGIGANVLPVWSSWTGKGVKVGVFDQGIDPFHSDLDGNLLKSLGRDANTLAVGGSPRTIYDNHGTAVAGVIAAEKDGELTIGVAPDASLVSIYTPFGESSFVQDIVNAFTYAKSLDVLNDSWGFAPQRYSTLPWAFFDNFDSSLFRPAYLALKDLADNGRDGLGTVVVQSAGNSFSLGDDTNLHNFQNSRYIITVAGTDYVGDVSWFSSQGASILVSAPGGGGGNRGYLGEILTTDRVGGDGYSLEDYTFSSGTSYAAPIVSGVVALMLETNPQLGYRDIQQILAYSAIKTAELNNTWEYNNAGNWNGGGLHFDAVTHNLGFGLVDALAAVRLAETWRAAPRTSSNAVEVKASLSRPVTIPDDDLIIQSVSIDESVVVERVELTVSINHTHIGDLGILLTSPSGTSSWMLYKPGESVNSPYGANQNNIDFTFNTVLSMGEDSKGQWNLAVFDFEAGDIGTLTSWSLNLIGHNNDQNDTYFYSHEYSESLSEDQSRAILSDSDGIDTLNASMLTTPISLDLLPGNVSLIDDSNLTIDRNTLIENAIGGDGADTIKGNYLGNVLWGMRGDDRIIGQGGDDIIYGGLGNDELIGNGGSNTLYGGEGDDNYFIMTSLGTDTFVEDSNEGIDTINTGFSFSIANIENIENLYSLNDTESPLTLIGNELDNIFKSSGGNCLIEGGKGIDTVSYKNSYAYDSCYIYIEQGELKVRKGNDSIDILRNIEFIMFSDRAIDLATAFIDVVAPVVLTTVYRTTIIGDKNIVGPNPILIRDLPETVVKTDGKITEQYFMYEETRYDYEAIDSLITVVTRDGEFANEFSQEMVDSDRSIANKTYSDIVGIVGTLNIDNWIISTAGSDGDFVN